MMKLGKILNHTGLSQEICVIDEKDADGDVLFAGLTISVPLEMRGYKVVAIGAYDSALFIDVVVPE